MTNVIIENKTNIEFKYEELYQQIAKVGLEILGIEGDSEINVMIVDNDEIQKISKEYKDKDKPTDVLSFPNDFEALRDIIGYNMIGDIFISHEKITEQAKEYGHSEKREWCYLFAHGLLHICGFDHIDPEEEKEMNGLAYQIMDAIGVSRND